MILPVLLLGILFPRVAIVLLWLLFQWFSGVYESILIPILGFIFLPFSLLWYTIVVKIFHEAWGFWQMIFMVLAVSVDLGAAGFLGRCRR